MKKSSLGLKIVFSFVLVGLIPTVCFWLNFLYIDKTLFWAVNGLIFFGVTIAAIYLSRSIVKPFRELNSNMGQNIKKVITSSDHLNSSSHVLSEISTQQAGSIQQTSASLEEISGIVKNNVAGSEKVVELITKVMGIADNCLNSMKKLQEAMGNILASNDRIEELVKVIGNIGEKTKIMDEIVFQTKLLSFNASVEAERAGEHGRGFAVVAQEVGNLAQMSGKAANEIAGIVKDSIGNAERIASGNKDKVNEGNALVDSTSLILKEVIETSVVASSSAQQIVKASKEQESGIKQINHAMLEIDKGTQTNSKNAVDTEKTSNELRDLLDSFSKLIFSLESLIHGKSSRLVGKNLKTNFVREQNQENIIPIKASENATELVSKTENVNIETGGQVAVNDENWEKL